MTITIKGNAKEVADLVLALQSQPKAEFIPHDSQGYRNSMDKKVKCSLSKN